MSERDTTPFPAPDRRHLERFFLQAWPAREEMWQAGWVLRAHDGYTGRANSATVLAPPTAAAPTIDDVEDFYAARRLLPKFRLFSFVDSRALDEQLTARGYRRRSPTLVLVRPLRGATGRLERAGANVTLLEVTTERWLDIYGRCRGKSIAADQRRAHGDILGQIAVPRLLAVLMDRSEPVACGVAVASAEQCALFDIAVQPRRRRAGLGRVLVEELLAWGAARGSRVACLQVEMENRPARHLYANLGFRASHFYWYRAASANLIMECD